MAQSTIQVEEKPVEPAANAKPADVSISTVGPTWGHEVSRKALQALVIFFVGAETIITWFIKRRQKRIVERTEVATDAE